MKVDTDVLAIHRGLLLFVRGLVVRSPESGSTRFLTGSGGPSPSSHQIWRVRRRCPTSGCSPSRAPWTGTSGMLAWVPPRRVMGRAFWSDPRIFDEYRSPVRARLHAEVPGRAMSPAEAQIVGHGRATHRPDVSSARACVMRSHASSPAAW